MELQKKHFYTEEEYEASDHDGLIEYDNGRIIAMSPPTRLHQKVVGRLFTLISTYLEGKTCEAYVAPFNVRLQLSDGIKRVEPDISRWCDEC